MIETALVSLSGEERETLAVGAADDQAKIASRSKSLALADDIVGDIQKSIRRDFDLALAASEDEEAA